MKTIIVGPAWSALAKKIAELHDSVFVPLTVTQFADTETCISLEHDASIAGAHVVLVYQLLRPKAAMSLNDQAMGLLQVIDALKLLGAKSISLFLPYLVYGRQDVNLDKQQPGAVFMFGRCLAALGATQLVACDMHAPAISTTFALPAHNIEIVSFWTDVIRKEIIKNNNKKVCIVSPDHGGRDRASVVAQQLGADFAFIRKMRVAQDTAVGYELIGAVDGKIAIIVDDIIDTGRTAASASVLLKSSGATAVYACFTHAVFSDGAHDRIKAGIFEKVFVTDTLGGELLHDAHVSQVSINEYVCQNSELWLRK